MSDNIKDRLAANLNQAKVTGSNRASSIKKILQDAASQTIAELKGGSSEIGAAARDTIKATVSEIKQPESGATSQTTDSSYYSNPGKTVASLLQTVKNKPIVERLKVKMENLDDNLSARYGERYEAISQKRRQVLEWYGETLENAEAEGSNPVEESKARLQERFGKAGSKVANKEKQVKEYFKTVFKKFNVR